MLYAFYAFPVHFHAPSWLPIFTFNAEFCPPPEKIPVAIFFRDALSGTLAAALPPHRPQHLRPLGTLSECLFFSVYTRSTPVEHGRHSCLPIFGGGNAIHSILPENLGNSCCCGAYLLLVFLLPPPTSPGHKHSHVFLPARQKKTKTVPPPPSNFAFFCFLRGVPQYFSFQTPIAGSISLGHNCAFWMGQDFVPRPSGLPEAFLLRTAILPGMHLNPSDFRS